MPFVWEDFPTSLLGVALLPLLSLPFPCLVATGYRLMCLTGFFCFFPLKQKRHERKGFIRVGAYHILNSQHFLDKLTNSIKGYNVKLIILSGFSRGTEPKELHMLHVKCMQMVKTSGFDEIVLTGPR